MILRVKLFKPPFDEQPNSDNLFASERQSALNFSYYPCAIEFAPAAHPTP